MKKNKGGSVAQLARHTFSLAWERNTGLGTCSLENPSSCLGRIFRSVEAPTNPLSSGNGAYIGENKQCLILQANFLKKISH